MATRYTPLLWEQFLTALRGGCTRPAALAKSHFTADDLNNWMQFGISGNTGAEIRQQVWDAEREAEANATAVIVAAWNNPDKRIATQNAQWFLERRFRGDWGQVDITRLPTERLLEIFHALAGQKENEKPLSLQELHKRRLTATVEQAEAEGQLADGNLG